MVPNVNGMDHLGTSIQCPFTDLIVVGDCGGWSRNLWIVRNHITVHCAFGAVYPLTDKSENANRWDMICDLRNGGRITINNEVFFKDGEFKV